MYYKSVFVKLFSRGKRANFYRVPSEIQKREKIGD